MTMQTSALSKTRRGKATVIIVMGLLGVVAGLGLSAVPSASNVAEPVEVVDKPWEREFEQEIARGRNNINSAANVQLASTKAKKETSSVAATASQTNSVAASAPASNDSAPQLNVKRPAAEPSELLAELDSMIDSEFSKAQAEEAVQTVEKPVAESDSKASEAKPVSTSEPSIDDSEMLALLELVKKSGTKKKVAMAFEKLMSMGENAAAEGLRALLFRRNVYLQTMREKGLASLKKLKSARAKLDLARKAAVTAIRDSDSYHKSNTGKVEGQDGVDILVQKLQAIWTARFKVGTKSSLSSQARWISAIDSVLARHAPETERPLSADDIQLAMLSKRPLSLQAFANDRHEIYMNWRNAQVEAWNAKNMPAGQEKQCLKILNDYRQMLGIHRLAYDARLLDSARGHSRDMSRMKFFAHESPLEGKRQPADRMTKSGLYETPTRAVTFFETGPIPLVISDVPGLTVNSTTGENIAFGVETGRAAFDLWYHSPPHHRNMIGDYDVIGIGKESNYWTQNFAGLNVSTGKRGE